MLGFFPKQGQGNLSGTPKPNHGKTSVTGKVTSLDDFIALVIREFACRLFLFHPPLLSKFAIKF